MVNHEISHESVSNVMEVSRAFKDLIVHWGACWVIGMRRSGCNVGNSHEQLSGDRLARISWPERANSRPSCRVAELGLSWSKPARLLMLFLKIEEDCYLLLLPWWPSAGAFLLLNRTYRIDFRIIGGQFEQNFKIQMQRMWIFRRCLWHPGRNLHRVCGD